jgi:long-chain acyl-CoA synthetase
LLPAAAQDASLSDAPFYVGFSSGSTGQPKAIVRRHGAWLSSFLAMSIEFGLRPETAIAAPGSLFFSFSLIAALHALTIGATLIVPGRDASGPTETLVPGPHTAYLLPSLLAGAVRRAGRRGERFTGIRQIICAGETLSAGTRAEAAAIFPRATIREYYGASELGFVTVIDDAEAAARPGSVGRAFLGAEIAILDDRGLPLRPGEVGRIGARTSYGFAGYAGDPLGAARIAPFGWPSVGDLGWRDADGYLYLAGRADRMVVIRGENVFPEQAERVLLAHPAVADAAVIPDREERPRGLVAYVVRREAVAARELIGACTRQLPTRAVPQRIVFRDAFPQTATGKVDRAALARDLPGGDAR